MPGLAVVRMICEEAGNKLPCVFNLWIDILGITRMVILTLIKRAIHFEHGLRNRRIVISPVWCTGPKAEDCIHDDVRVVETHGAT